MAFLAMNRHLESSRERVQDTFWPDSDPEHARASLNTALWSIRRCLRTAGVEPDIFLQASKSTIRWAAETDVDATRFAEAALRDDQTREALDLFRGDFLEGDYDDWVVAERERLAALYETVLARAVRTSKDPDAAVRFIERNPYGEEAYAALIDVELAAGRRSSAVAWIERCRKALAELGEKPSAAFESRFAKVVHVEPVLSSELTLPFGGRDAELGTLAAKSADAAQGRGSITLVHGEAGIGKSTLLARVAQFASGSGVRVVMVRGDATGTFGPWQGVFAGLGGGDFDAFARAHGGGVATAVARDIVERLSSPSIVLVDDTHGLSGDAFDVFCDLMRFASERHAVVAFMRPEGVSAVRAKISDLESEEVVVKRLARDHLKWALAQTLGDEHPEVLDAIYTRSGGHPLFFTGLLNSLVSQGALERDGRVWRLTKHIDSEMKLPDTVRRFIEARLHARGEQPRAVACALALEPAASADDLAAVLRLDEPAALDAIDDLLALGLIAQPAAGTQFAFTHDLVREVASMTLNVGRRTVLHRAFAQRLGASGEREASLRLAYHLRLSGDLLPAAQSYLRAADAALELNAAQDAIDRCDAGVAAATELERSTDRDRVLARLRRTSARGAILLGNTESAIARAREAVAMARSCGDLAESSRSILDLAMMEGCAFQTAEQQSDAAEAARVAAAIGDAALEAEAMVQTANAARELGDRDAALRSCRAADASARRAQRPDILVAATEELLRTQITWWQFADAQKTARDGLDAARRSSPLAEAAIRLTNCTLWYLLERFDDAKGELEASMRLARESALRGRDPTVSPAQSVPIVLFVADYMAAKIANELREWTGVMDSLRSAAACVNVARLPRYLEALTLLRIDALLRRESDGDTVEACDLATSLRDDSYPQAVIGWSDCTELARARCAARARSADASELLHGALDVVEENAHLTPLETDRAFARLANAADEIGDAPLAARASDRSAFYRARRRAAAGSAWGG
jgi:DNA-binding SARP family transcriptional activator